jgi:hypothetical protein
MEVERETYNGWNEYKQLVIHQLKGLTDRTEIIENKLDNKTQDIERRIDILNVKLQVLETKIVIYSALAGIIAGALFQLAISFIH